MNITFLGQGYEAASKLSVGNHIIKFLLDKDFHSFTGISAFASLAGIRGLSKTIEKAKEHLKNITIVTGVDQKGTSKEALEEILALKVKSFIFYQPSKTIFHPKIYLFEGEKNSELIIGSSNLTAQGLFTNVEASMLLSIDNTIEIEREIIIQIKDYFKGIFDYSDPNLKKITKTIIADLVKAKVVPTEAERKAAYEKEKNGDGKVAEKIISKFFPKRAAAKIPAEFKGKKGSATKITKSITSASGISSPLGNLVWTRKKIPRSSVQLSTGNPTGGLRLVQDNFIVSGSTIDQTTYFRKSLFGKYAWVQVKAKPLVESANVPFEVTIKGKFLGRYDLEVRHKPSGEAGQGNYTSSISWGDLGETIKSANLTGSRLDLYSPKSKRGAFQIVIS